jgi:16S rRNA (adenine1518-N6/adenine1519-N6)-dimethyltransferase
LDISIHPKKTLGQHFLTDTQQCDRIATLAAIKPDDTVIEIGPGTGNLTEILLQRAGRVIAIEFDRDLIRYLEDRFSLATPSEHRLSLIHSDVLALDWKKMLLQLPLKMSSVSSAPWSAVPAKLVGNLPYNISTRLLSSMTKLEFRFHCTVVMVQREVGRRITANPGSKDYGYFSLLMQYHYRPDRGFDVQPGAFRPIPEVVSQVVKLTPRSPSLKARAYERFLRIIQTAFQKRRKTLRNNLKTIVADEALLARCFDSCEIDRKARPEQVSLDQYICMTRMLSFNL